MQDFDGQNVKVDVNLLEHNIEQLVAQLNECRKENEVLRSELESLQNILRSCKLPGTFDSPILDGGSVADGTLTEMEKVQIRQKLVLLLQKIEIELRNIQSV